LEKIIGVLGYARALVFAKFARVIMGPMYRKLYLEPYIKALDKIILDAFRWWLRLFEDNIPRAVAMNFDLADFLLYTDASLEGLIGGLGAVFFKPADFLVTGRAFMEFSGQVSDDMLSLCEGTSAIYILETLAAVLAFGFLAVNFPNSSVRLFIDNNACNCALTKAGSRIPMQEWLLQTFWFLAAKHNMRVWVERVSTQRNCSDEPSRFKESEFNPQSRGVFPTLRDLVRWYPVNFPEVAKRLFEEMTL
jgi:hypothetical protein